LIGRSGKHRRLLDHPLEPVIGGRAASIRWRVMTTLI
jgi:hypothetical protein